MQGRRGWADIGAGKSKVEPIPAVSAAQKESKEVEKSEAILADTIRSTLLVPEHGSPTDEVFGITRGWLRPANIGTLASLREILPSFRAQRLRTYSSELLALLSLLTRIQNTL